MTTQALTTELEAVNTLLGAIGESPINSLAVTGLADVSSAKAALDEISREVQSTGWHFNTEDGFPLSRDPSGRIYVPANALKVLLPKKYLDTMNVVQRGLKLYDKKHHTDIFTADLEAGVVFLLGWDELPQVVRHYIMVRASRIFQARTLGSDTQFRFSEEEEGTAKREVQEAEGETGNYNMFTDSYSVASSWLRM